MDWSDWTKLRDQSFPRCFFDCEPERNYTEHDWERGFNFEEIVLNEKACDQVRRILLGKENAEILKLKDVTSLENQLAWADVSWSEMDSVPLSEKVKSLDLSMRSFTISNSGNNHDFSESSLIYRELIERWQKILKLVPEKYFDQKAKQANDVIIKRRVLAILQSESGSITGVESVNSFTPEKLRMEDEVKEVMKSNIKESVIADKYETTIIVKKGDFSLSTSEKMRREEVDESMDDIVKVSVSDDLQHKTDPVMETSRNKEEINQFVGHILEPASRDSHRVSDETGKDAKVSKDTKGDLKTEKKRTDAQGIEIPGGSVSGFQMNESDLLLDFINKKREQLAKINPMNPKNKKAESVDCKSEPSLDLLLELRKPKAKEVFMRTVKVEYDLYEPQNQSIDSALKPQLKRKSHNLPGIENEKKLKGLDHNLALPANSTRSSSMESLDNNNFPSADARTEETSEVLPSSILPGTTPGRRELSSLKLTDLKEMAKQINLKGYSKLTKSELIEELYSRLAVRGN